jgi:carbon monoxide dehydrogenase subunit G
VTQLLAESVTLSAPRAAIWRIVNDPAALRRVLPGCESLEELGEGRYQAVMASRLQFLTLRLSGTCEVVTEAPAERFELRIAGKPLGLVGTLTVSVPVVLTDADDGASTTCAEYRVDLTMTGRLAAFGAPIVRNTVKGQIRQLIANVEREAQT